MTEELRLSWEPENKTPLKDIEERLRTYMQGKDGGVSLLNNGTLIFSNSGRDDIADANQAMERAKFFIDFQVTPLKEGGFFVSFHEAIAVFVGDHEFSSVRNEVKERIDELKFPEEEFFGKDGSPDDHLLIGLYARGKLQKDAHHFNFHCRIG